MIEHVRRIVDKESPAVGPAGEAGIREIFLEITYRCDQKCLMCDVWPRYLKAPELRDRELTMEEIKGLVTGSRRFDSLELAVLTGGEPFLRPDLPEIAGFFLEKFPSLTLVLLTNGFNTGPILNALREIEERWGLSRVCLGSSLDGIGETHDRVRGCPGAFKALEETIERVRRGWSSLSLSLNFTLTPLNYRELLPAFEFARGRGIDFSAQFPISWEGAKHFSWEKDELAEVERSIGSIIRELVGDKQKAEGEAELLRDYEFLSKIYYWQGLAEYGKSPRRLFAYCQAGSECAMFDPQGGLYLCPLFKHDTLGNIREKGFEEIWGSVETEELRERIRTGQCHCWLNCMVYSFAYRALKRNGEGSS